MIYNHIATQEHYEAIAARIEQLVNAAAGSPEAKELKLLTKLIVEYEMQRPVASSEQSRLT